MKRKVLLLLAAGFASMLAAQNTERPGWTYNTPKAGNNTYVYVVERGSGTTVNEAVNNALLKVLRTSMMRIGAVVSWDEVNASLQQGTDWGAVAMKYNIPINKVCEYVEHKTEHGFLVAVLCQVAKSGAVYPDFDEFTACNDTKKYSDGAALLKSAFIPGLGQMGKQHVGSGVFTLVGEVALAGHKKILPLQKLLDYGPEIIDIEQKYETCRYVNIVCLSAAGALYVYNLVRAYSMAPKYKNSKLTLGPTLLPMDNGWNSGISLTFKF